MQSVVEDVTLTPAVIRSGGSFTFSITVSDPAIEQIELTKGFGSCVSPHFSPAVRERKDIVIDLPGDMETVILRDDGSNGDAAADDRVFTLGGIEVSLNKAKDPTIVSYWYGMLNPDWPFLSRRAREVTITYADGTSTETELFVSVPCGVLDPSVPIPAINEVAEGVRRTSHVIALSTLDEISDDSFGLGYPPLSRRFEQRSVLEALQSMNLAQRIGFVILQEFSGVAQVYFRWNRPPGVSEESVSSADFPGVRGVVMDQRSWSMREDSLPNAFRAYDTTIHEFLHGWASHLPEELQISDGSAHYQLPELASSCFNGNGIYTRPSVDYDDASGRAIVEQAVPPDMRCNSLELYLMGLADKDEVGPIAVAVNPDFRERENLPDLAFSVPADGLRVVTIDDIITAVGERTPLPPFPRPVFRAVHVLADDRPIADLELALFHHRAVDMEKRRSLYGMTFEEAARDRMNFVTRISVDEDGDGFPDAVGADSDGDGLGDEEELRLGTATDRADTDFDVIPDRIEVEKLSTDPLVADDALNRVQRAYIAYYGRPADPVGLGYWAEETGQAGGRLDRIIEAFGASDEFSRRYGGLSNTELVTRVYRQLLNRLPDPGGLSFYVDLLDSGQATLQTITLDVLGGVQDQDVAVVNNKIEAAWYFTGEVSSGCGYGGEQRGVDYLDSVDEAAASVRSANAQLQTSCAGTPVR